MRSNSVLRCAVLAVASGCGAAANALENASTHAPLGFTDSLHGGPIPNGFYVRLDVLEYRSTRFNDQNGDRAQASFGAALAAFGVPPGTPGTSGPVHLKATGTYGQVTLFKQTPTSISFLGSDQLGFGATFLYGTQRVDLNANVPIFAAFGQPTVRDLGSGQVSTLGDTAIFPLFLTWSPTGTPWTFRMMSPPTTRGSPMMVASTAPPLRPTASPAEPLATDFTRYPVGCGRLRIWAMGPEIRRPSRPLQNDGRSSSS